MARTARIERTTKGDFRLRLPEVERAVLASLPGQLRELLSTDDSALRRRYYRGCEVAGLRRVKLHGLRHAAGSILARVADPVFVRDYLGHSKLTTTDRYVSAKHRPEDFERLNRAFGVVPRDEREPVETETTA